MQDAGGTTESFYILGSLLLLNNPSGSLILASQAILAVYHALSCGRSLGPLGKPLQPLSTMAGAHRERALFAMGFLDIIAFVQLLFHALTGGCSPSGTCAELHLPEFGQEPLDQQLTRNVRIDPRLTARLLSYRSICPLASLSALLSLSLSLSHSPLTRTPARSYYSPVWDAIGRSAVGQAAKRLPFFDSVRLWFQSGAVMA